MTKSYADDQIDGLLKPNRMAVWTLVLLRQSLFVGEVLSRNSILDRVCFATV